jgi:addiction module HigA family antidote
MADIKPIHPGEILAEEFMEPLGISQNALAKAINVSPRRINEIVNKKRSVTADTALRLSLYFGTTADFWLKLQSRYDLETVKEASMEKIKSEVKAYVA